MAAKETCIEMKGIGRRFGPDWILSGLDLKIHQGESVALFGNNGSGKSTLLKILSTLLAPTTGKLSLFDQDVAREKEGVRRRLCLLAHEKQLYEMLTVKENLSLAAQVRGLRLSSGILQGILERLQILGTMNQRVRELSEGTKKRVVLSRMLLGDPDLILLDEPHPTLDTHGKKILNELIAEWRQKGKTILLASHDHEQALSRVDRLLVLNQGAWAYDGKPMGLEAVPGLERGK